MISLVALKLVSSKRIDMGKSVIKLILFLKLYGTKRRWKFKLKSDSGFSVSFGGIAFFGAFHVHWPSITTSRFIPEKLNSKASSFWITC